MKKKILGVLMIVVAMGSVAANSFCNFDFATMEMGKVVAVKKTDNSTTTTAGSSGSGTSTNCTSILPDSMCNNKDAVIEIVRLVLYVLTAGVGILGLAGIVTAGVQYATAADNDQQVVAAKERIRNIVIGLFLWVFLFAMLNLFLIGKTS